MYKRQTLPAGLRRVAPPKARTSQRFVKPSPPQEPPELTAEQKTALAAIAEDSKGFRAYLLHGVTGSGKTEIYLRLVERSLAAGRQVLMLVPEINLTPQLESRVAARFPSAGLVSLHSELTEAARTRNWRAALEGRARIVLGTRPVSYTHLDVYKRQVTRSPCKAISIPTCSLLHLTRLPTKRKKSSTVTVPAIPATSLTSGTAFRNSPSRNV